MKPCINLTIDKDLLDKLESKRLDRIQKEQKVISRSAYISELITKGLKK
ncbi:hypothetical protein BhaS171_00051 [Bacillus phage vB_BhaS-171]|nr:transcriptional repressor [Bacillus phage vB_BhaS-171]ALY08107.1 hypothetical protein BhaS171_00051 [Bacillus phage vB_BhaS-171]